MVYSFNRGIGWASSGVEYAQSYRANLLRKAGIDAKFVFTDMFPVENIEHLTSNIGFLDSEIIWLYTYFTDTKIAPVTFTRSDLEKTFSRESYSIELDKKTCIYNFSEGTFCRAHLSAEGSECVHRVDIVSDNKLIRKDYYTYCKIYSEYYAPLDGKAHMYSRRFFNENGSVAYDELKEDGEDRSFYRFKDDVIFSKQDLVAKLVRSLDLTDEDVVIIDRSTEIGQPIMENSGTTRVMSVIHADHFNASTVDDDNILWNNYYEYLFSMDEDIDAYITATDAQNKLMRQQFVKMGKKEPNVITIPVGSLDELKISGEERKKHSLITASRLADEKHCDWLIEAVIKAREEIGDITLDIYGSGGAEPKLRKMIDEYGCGDCVRMMGQQKLEDVYMKYDAYISASQSEGFGLSLMEAIGSGLPIIGFDVRYGNQTFIDNGQNGYAIPISDDMDKNDKINLLVEYIIKMFKDDDMDAFHVHSYEKAKEYLTDEVVVRWKNLLK